MSIFNTESFSFQTKFSINESVFSFEISSGRDEEQQEMITGRQVITLKDGENGVSMIRRETMMEEEEPEFLMTGLGLMETFRQEELRTFALMWVMRVQEGLMMGTREDEVAGAIDVGPVLQSLGCREFLEILEHFFNI